MMRFNRLLTLSLVLLAAPLAASAEEVRITVRNVAPADSVATSPFFLAAHDGAFDAFDPGAVASVGVEDVAELGDNAALADEVNATQPGAVTDTLLASEGGFNGMIFTPGSSGSVVLTLDPAAHRFLTFGAMVVPSNDAFFGAASPTEVGLFDAAGNFVAGDFTLTGADVWDAGTEVNQLLGAAYVVGQSAGEGDTEGGTIELADLSAAFSPFVGADAPSGATFNAVPTDATSISAFSFQLIPEPSALGLALLGAAAAGSRRRSP